MRFIGTLIKYFIYLCVILIALGVALFWFDTGSWLVKPLAERAGNFFLSPLKIEIENVNGSVRNGFDVDGLKIISGDENLLSLNHFDASPDWDLALKGKDGLPFVKSINVRDVSSNFEDLKINIKNINGSVRDDLLIEGINLASGDEDFLILNHIAVKPDWDLILKGIDEGLPFIKSLDVRGLSSDLEKVMTLVNKFSASEDKKEEEKTPLKLSLQPFNLSIRDIFFGTPYSNLELNSLTLNEAGKLFLDSKIISNDNIFPFKINALVNVNDIEIISSDLSIGNKGKGTLTAKLEPLKANLNLTALSLEEFLKFAPPIDIKASGRIDGKFFAQADSENNIKASGVLSMPRANVMDIPLNFRLPFNWDGKSLFSLSDAKLNTQAAKLFLNLSADISNMKIKAMGKAENLSLTEIGAMFAPDVKLKGEGGNIDFDVDTVASGDILSNTVAKLNANIPSISAVGMNILQNLTAKIKLNRQDAPKIDINGKIFGGKLFARGEAVQDKDGNIKPQAVISIINLDVPTLIKTFPAAAKSIKKPYGKISTRSVISDNLNVNTDINSEKISVNGITLTNIKAGVDYDVNKNTAGLEKFSANLGKGLITASGGADLNTGIFNASAKVDNVEPKIIPELKSVMGLLNLKASASGNFNNLNSINANADINAKNFGYDGMKLGDINLPLKFSNNILNISNAKAIMHGGILSLKGNVNIKNINNPGIDLSASTNGINLANTLKALNLQDKNMPISGKILGAADVKGSVNNPSFHASLRVEKFKAGTDINMPEGLIEARGDMKKITINTINAKLNDAKISGYGTINPNQKNFANSSVAVYTNIKNLDLKPLLSAFMEKPPVTGVIDASANLKGTISKAEGELKILKPIYYGKNEIEDINIKLNSPEANHYRINAKAKIEKFNPEADIDVINKDGIISYNVNTKPLDINRAIETQMPNMAGIAKGFAVVNVSGNTKPNSNINIHAKSKEIKVMDKISIKDISLPLIFSQAKQKIEMKKGVAFLSDGEINTNLDVDLAKKVFEGKVKVSHLDFGKLAAPFLPEGELIGQADAQATMKGSFGFMPTNFAHGKFSTTPGYLHKMGVIDKFIPTKKISFENISGSFFWDGNDLFLNPGTGARAGKDEPLYRYVNVNGSMGIPGKGLNLLCDGRFDLKILDQLLGAMKGVFQYMTGNLARNVLRDAAGRVLGIKSRDFQSVSFRLANSWQQLRLLDMKITKPIEDFLPLDILNKDEEKQRDDTQFKLNLRIPVGKGEESVEDESTTDQFKQQLIDNLFNIGI